MTKGAITLDVEDGLSLEDWPGTQDVSLDCMRFSVHLPIEPKCVVWPGGSDSTRNGVVRVLNIIPDESRILASRERCPFLLQVEVVDSGLEGNDARLYAGGHDIGTTVQEVLGILGKECKLPNEILDDHTHDTDTEEDGFDVRGGNQDDYYAPMGYENQCHNFRQQEYEMLHHEMMNQRHQNSQTTSTQLPPAQISSVGSCLLDKVFGPPFQQKCHQIRSTSHYGNLKGWRLASFILKSGEDIRREALAMQTICKLKQFFDRDLPPSLRPYLKPYAIMCVGADAGMLECLADAKSVDEVKKETDGFTTLRDYFARAFGSPDQPPASVDGLTFRQAQQNFLRSLVGYSLVCYILQIKDRHNANILLTRDGHLIHIDFGFVLGDTPKMGRVPLFAERAPFKLTADFWEVIGGWDIDRGGLGVKFCKMLEAAFACASLHRDEIAGLVRGGMLNLLKDEGEARKAGEAVRNRLRMRGAVGSVEQKNFIMDLVNAALTSWGTSTYDWLQKSMNGYQ